MIPGFVTLHDDANRVFAFDNMRLKQLWGKNCFSKFVRCRLQARNPVDTNSIILEFSTICWISMSYCSPWFRFLHCLPSILSDVLIDFSFVSVRRGSWRATTSGWDDRRCLCFRLPMSYPHSDQASTHAGFSTCTLKSWVCIWCRDFPLKRK
jgi:hypothetical protein